MLHNVMQATSAVTAEMALRFEKAFGGSADMSSRMEAAYDLARARKNQGKMNPARRRLGPASKGSTANGRLNRLEPRERRPVRTGSAAPYA